MMKFNENILLDIDKKLQKIILEVEKVNDISVKKGIEYLCKIYELYEEGTNEYLKKSSCKRGCSTCCYLYANCTPIEAEYMKRTVISNKLNITELENTINKYSEIVYTFEDMMQNNIEGREHLSNLHFGEKIPCLFINEKKECSIYKSRPLTCRKFISFSNQVECEKDSGNVLRPEFIFNTTALYAIDLLSTKIEKYKAQTIEEGYDCGGLKSYYGTVYHWFKYGFDKINLNKSEI